MLVKALAVIMAGCSLVACSRANSQRQPDQQPKATQDVSSGNPNDSAKAPIFVKILPTAKTPEEASKEETQRQDQSDANWAMVKLTGAIAFLGFAQLIAIGCQVRVAATQNSIMGRQNFLIKGQLKAAEDAANAAKASADAANDNAKAASDLVVIGRTEQRAWVGALTLSVAVFKPGKRAKFWVQLKNSGRTPAKRMRIWATMTALNPGEGFEFKPPVDTAGQSVVLLQPNAAHIVAVFSPQPLTEPAIAAIKEKQVTIHVFGHIDYDDVFGSPHFSEFHTFYRAIKNDLVIADTHNDCD